jgi:glycosyltransferase involved in cell wall biosynthesis
MVNQAGNGRPEVLFIAPIMPSDRGNGLAMRTGFILDSYAKRFAIKLIVVPVAGGTKDLTPFVEGRVSRAVVLPVGAPDTHFALIAGVADPKARLSAFRQYGRPSITSLLNAELEHALHALAYDTSYAFVHVSRLYLASLAASWMNSRGGRSCLVLDCDEDDVSAYRRFAQLYRFWGQERKANWAAAEADAFKSLAAQLLPRFDLLLAASTGEAELLSRHAGEADIAVVPNAVPGYSEDVSPFRRREGRSDILFVGNMGYPPNIDAVKWFATHIWPKLRASVQIPLRFVIAGHGATREMRSLARRPEIVLAGGFDDPATLYRRAALAVVPIRAGGGTRIKLLEGARYGVPLVSTNFGAEGSGFRSGRELLLADSAQDFAACCARLLTDFTLASRLVARAQAKLRRDYESKRLAERLLHRIDVALATGAKRR